MSILSAKKIVEQRLHGNIVIDPFSIENINPNSYNISLYPKLLKIGFNSFADLLYEYDMARPAQCTEIDIPSDGYVLEPGELYLGQTNEIAGSTKFVPMIEGRSSIGRCGMFIHITAGFGDVGFVGRWTLEIVSVKRLRIYPNINIGQVFFHEIDDTTHQYSGQYADQREIRTSGIWKEIKK